MLVMAIRVWGQGDGLGRGSLGGPRYNGPIISSPGLSHVRLTPIVPVRLGLSCWSIGAAWLPAAASTAPAVRALPACGHPYRMDVVGQFRSREQVEALQAGMDRQQVRDILGAAGHQPVPCRPLG